MAETEEIPKVSAPSRPPMITLPPRVSPFDTLFTGLSPGPLTLVSNFFSDQYPETDCRSFSQLLAGAMASPVAILPPAESGNDGKSDEPAKDEVGTEKNSGFKQNRPVNLVVSPSPMFMFPSGLSPSGLLSPGFFSPAQSPFGMSHQQALAHVTAQAALSQSYFNIQAEYPPPPSLAGSGDSLEQQQQAPTVTSDLEDSQMESPDASHLDKKLQPASHSVDKPANDGYSWRKYGQKQVKASDQPRSYYKCTHANCPVKKKVGRSPDGQISDIVYKGQHNHDPPQPNKRSKEAAELSKARNSHAKPEQNLHSQSETSRSLEVLPSQVALPVENNQVTTQVVDSEKAANANKRMHDGDYDEPSSKRSNVELGTSETSSQHRTVTEPKIVVQTRSEVDLLDDGYKWRKYGQKVVKGNIHPRSYYKCTYSGCNVRKHVERAPSDPKAVVTTYEGKHNHDIPVSRHRGYAATNSSQVQVKPEKKPSRHKGMNFEDDERPVVQMKEEQIIA